MTSTPAWRTSQSKLDAGRLEHAARRLGQLGPGPVAGDEGDAMGHERGRSYLRSRRILGQVASASMSETADFKPGPRGRRRGRDRDRASPIAKAASLRYRGVDIEELVGHYPVRERLGPARRRRPRLGDARAGAVRAGRLTGNAPSDLQAETARLSGVWKLGKLNEISDEQAREDLGGSPRR